MKTADWGKFAEKVRLGIESSIETHFERGLSGLELEFNVLDSAIRPVTTVGFGPGRRSFSDYLMAEHIPKWVGSRFQLEVFHWMTEAATRPYYDLRGTAMEGRVLEAVVLNALAGAGLAFGEQFLALHGNLPYPVEVGEESIPDGWSLAKKRYLARCVGLYGSRLATAGIHTNHSYPEALLSWDFFHLPRHRREGRTLVDFRNEAVIRATRLLRPFCPLFIAVTASTPFNWETVNGRPEVVLTEVDSNRLLTFPNPPELDVPYLYASHQDYLRISYDLVRRGVRFGANNWTPVRARSDVDPVNRNIWATSEQLLKLYQKGLYRAGEHASLEEAEQALLVENLCARVDLPMNRVEVRTDEGGDSLELSAAKIAFKECLMLMIYGDEAFGAGYAYDAEDVARARRNEEQAARDGLKAHIEHPFTGDRVPLRAFLRETLDGLDPLAEALGYSAHLAPIREMAQGAPNEAERTRAHFARELRGEMLSPWGNRVVPRELFRKWLGGRRELLRSELAAVLRDQKLLGDEQAKLGELLAAFEEAGRRDPSLPVLLAAAPRQEAVAGAGDELSEVLALSQALCRIPSVTNCPRERLEEVWRCAHFIAGELREAGAQVRLFQGGRYPAVLAGFPGGLLAPVTLGGHFDVVEPDPNDTQFEPRIEGDYLWARGAADMKTVVATNMIWMKRALKAGPPYPPVNLLLVGNEENGESEAYGTPQVLKDLKEEALYAPEFMIFGERTGERGDERFGEICTANRGVVRLRIVARGERGHTGVAGVPKDLSEQLIQARQNLHALMEERLTLHSPDGWQTGARFPFFAYGEPGVYNVTPGEGILGLEIRPIPEDSLDSFVYALQEYCQANDMEVLTEVMEAGVACPAENPHLQALFDAAAEVSGKRPQPANKLAGTSARFAPGGNAVVWGQSGIGPHSRHERHFIPSIEPYLRILGAFARRLAGRRPAH
jgi:succinyl-diaminopimelate desuccinylase